MLFFLTQKKIMETKNNEITPSNDDEKLALETAKRFMADECDVDIREEWSWWFGGSFSDDDMDLHMDRLNEEEWEAWFYPSKSDDKSTAIFVGRWKLD
jgi:hypothetical protein